MSESDKGTWSRYMLVSGFSSIFIQCLQTFFYFFFPFFYFFFLSILKFRSLQNIYVRNVQSVSVEKCNILYVLSHSRLFQPPYSNKLLILLIEKMIVNTAVTCMEKERTTRRKEEGKTTLLRYMSRYQQSCLH